LPLILVHGVAVAALAFGLSGLSVGLGAAMPNFRETDPSKIAVGFGGTINLIVSLLFLLLVIGLIAAPWHLWIAFAPAESATNDRALWLLLPAGIGIALGVVAAVFPLRLGARALRDMEF
jgi:ABC-2 type transport system permease protein